MVVWNNDPTRFDPFMLKTATDSFRVDEDTAGTVLLHVATECGLSGERVYTLSPVHLKRAGIVNTAMALRFLENIHESQHGVPKDHYSVGNPVANIDGLQVPSYTDFIGGPIHAAHRVQDLQDFVDAALATITEPNKTSSQGGMDYDKLATALNSHERESDKGFGTGSQHVRKLDPTVVKAMQDRLYSSTRVPELARIERPKHPEARASKRVLEQLNACLAPEGGGQPRVPKPAELSYVNVTTEAGGTKVVTLKPAQTSPALLIRAATIFYDSMEAVALSVRGPLSSVSKMSGGFEYFAFRDLLGRVGFASSDSADLHARLESLQTRVSILVSVASSDFDVSVWPAATKAAMDVLTEASQKPASGDGSGGSGSATGSGAQTGTKGGNGGSGGNADSGQKPPSARAEKRKAAKLKKKAAAAVAQQAMTGYYQPVPGQLSQAQQAPPPKQGGKYAPYPPPYHPYAHPYYPAPPPYAPPYGVPPQPVMAPPPPMAPPGGPQPPPGAPPVDNRPKCFDFQKGQCTRGAACKFSHSP